MTQKSPDKPFLTDALLGRFVADECTPLERAQVTAWIGGRPERLRTVELLRIARFQLTDPDSTGDVDIEPAWAALRLQMRANRGTVKNQYSSGWVPRENGVRTERLQPTSSRNRLLRRALWSFGSAIIAGLAFVVLGSRQLSGDRGITRTYTTNQSESATLTLNDGTRVTLAPQTTLQLINFGQQSRTITLTGTALFDVVHASGTPFIVQTGVAQARVLGTTFLVRSQGLDLKTHVTVINGKVRVMPQRRSDGAVVLTAGQMAGITDSVVHVNTVDVDPSRDWVRGQLVFRDKPITAILETLTRWYGYQFHCTDSALVQRTATMWLSMQSSAEALATLEQVLNVNLTVHGDTVTLSPHPAHSTTGVPRARVYDVWIPTREVGR